MTNHHRAILCHAQTIFAQALADSRGDDANRPQLQHQIERALKLVMPLPPSPPVDDLRARLIQALLTCTPELTLEFIAAYGYG